MTIMLSLLLTTTIILCCLSPLTMALMTMPSSHSPSSRTRTRTIYHAGLSTRTSGWVSSSSALDTGHIVRLGMSSTTSTTNSNKKKRKKRGRNSQSSSSSVKQQPSRKDRRKHLQATKSTQHINNQQQQKKQAPKKLVTQEELDNMTIGQAIQEAYTEEQLLNIVQKRFWLPTDDDLPPHIRTQLIHHEKRMRWASLLLEKLGNMYIMSPTTVTTSSTDTNTNTALIWNDDRLVRAILAVSLPFVGKDKNGNPKEQMLDVKKEKQIVRLALLGLHSIAGSTITTATSKNTITINDEAIEGLNILIQRAERIASTSTKGFSLSEAVEVRWAIKGVLCRVCHLSPDSGSSSSTNDTRTKNLDDRVSNLPFDIRSQCLDWSSLLQEQGLLPNHNIDHDDGVHDDTTSSESQNTVIMKGLLTEIPFRFDSIHTRSGSIVQERRSTAWIADEGVGSLAYSGKLMQPHPIPPIVRAAMSKVEQSIFANSEENSVLQWDQEKLCFEETGRYFDCSLCNHYPNSDSACKFHTDPEHGTYWERLTCVVSAGKDDIRKFAFRPIPSENSWSSWEHDSNTSGRGNREMNHGEGEEDISPSVIPLFPGDVVCMWGECNDVFHHAVYSKTEQSFTKNPVKIVDDEFGGRVSLVFKRAIELGNGRRGHGRSGEGRRSRKRQ